jgi:ferric-dicitrate binding protein FerR (iron transport regulator)
VVDDLEKIREGLRAMPVPEPRPGFEDRVLANASSRAQRRQWRGIWWAAAAGVLAAAIAWGVLMWVQPGANAEPSVMLALNESREVSLVIDSERDLEGATLRLFVSGSVDLVGFEGQQQIEWPVSLTQGANLLSLPVVARTPGDGRVVAEIEHHGRTRRVSVALHVSAQPLATIAPVRG